ncbi:MAG: serine/threonine protein kinase [Gemmatimonadaceae bacterium]|nr:serine/threonine protein kinase [Gemmatimonadaceae bacterium]
MTSSGRALTPEQFAQLEALFADALEQPDRQRDAFISNSTANNPLLERELRALLAAHARTDSFRGISTPLSLDFDTLVGTRLGAFVVGPRIGMGGMGAVHEGTRADDQYQQRVAVKFLRRSADDTNAVARFRAEQQFLASLQHPNIASLLDGGVTPTGTPYFIMEYIDGAPITAWCDERRLSVRQRVLLFKQVCLAVRAAHQRLVVHRDLKPSNIFVTDNGTVKLLDFGIAKLLSDADVMQSANTPVTAIGQQAFTPEYAAPEQIRGETVDTRADIYALGVVLYELLTGKRPVSFAGVSPYEMAQQISDVHITPMDRALVDERFRALAESSTERARRKLQGDLDAIARVALRAEPARRYASVDALLDDVDRYLDGRPVAARPDGAWYRARKFLARHALETGAAVIAIVSLVTGVVVSQQQRRVAQAESTRAKEITDFLTTMLGASSPESFGKDVTMREVLDSAAIRLDADSLPPELSADIRSIIGGTYLSLGEYAVADTQFMKMLAERRKAAPNGDYGTALALSKLSLIQENNGHFEQADSLLLLAEQMYERHPHPEPLEEVGALENRGRVLHLLGRGREAVEVLRKAFAVARAGNVMGDPSMATTYVNAAVIATEVGEFAAADSFSARGVEIARAGYGNDNPTTLSAMSVRSGTLEQLGRLEESRAMLYDVMEGRRRVLGGAHPSYAITMSNYADLLNQQEKWSEAARYARDVVAMRGKSVEEAHPVMGAAMMHLGRALARMDSLAASERVLREGLALRIKYLPANHYLIALSESTLGEYFTIARNFTEAERWLLDAEKKLVTIRGEKAPLVRDVRLRLVALYEAWGKPSEVAAWKARLTP